VDDGKKIVMNYPGNSHRKRGEEREKPKREKVEKIIRGHVVKKKKSFFRKLADTFLGSDVPSVSGYIIHDVLIPAAKDTLEDLVKGSIEVLLRGETRGYRGGRGGSGGGGRSYVRYDKASYRNDKEDRREPSSRNRARHNFDDIVLDSRGEAEEVLSTLVDLVEDYDVASVADLYDLVGIESSFVDTKYGWTNLSRASVSRVRDGYLIDLPRALPLD